MTGTAVAKDALLQVTIALFATSPEAQEWSQAADSSEPEADCAVLAPAFTHAARRIGMRARTCHLVAADDAADPLQGDHYVTVVALGGRLYGVDWTARQFDTIDGYDGEWIPVPLVWDATYDPAGSYPLRYVRFALPGKGD